MRQFIKYGYTYEELNGRAREAVKRWYLDDPTRSDIFHETIIDFLKEEFPRSELKCCFSLGYCQGDGLNIYGKINLYDFVEKWNASDKEKRTILFYIDESFNQYTFEVNNHYCYSCKFIDKKYIDSTVEEFIENLEYQCIRSIHTHLIEQFFLDMINYFEELDRDFEKEGYNYLYNVDDEEIQESCAINEWYFDINGKFIYDYDAEVKQ